MIQSHDSPQGEINPVRSTIEKRIDKLRYTAVRLARIAQKWNRLAVTSRVTLIVLGALVTIREVVQQLLGEFPTVVWIYIVVGLLIATIAGLEAAFKWEERSAELRVLAANCRNAAQFFESDLARIDIAATREEGLAAEQELLTQLDERSKEVYEKAASLKVNAVLDMASPDSERWMSVKGDFA